MLGVDALEAVEIVRVLEWIDVPEGGRSRSGELTEGVCISRLVDPESFPSGRDTGKGDNDETEVLRDRSLEVDGVGRCWEDWGGAKREGPALLGRDIELGLGDGALLRRWPSG